MCEYAGSIVLQEMKDGAKIGRGPVLLMKQHGHLAGQQHFQL
jgi:hypothetical protein